MGLLTVIVLVLLFSLIVYGAVWAIEKFKLPTIVSWIFGIIVLLILLLFMLKVTGLYTGPIDIKI